MYILHIRILTTEYVNVLKKQVVILEYKWGDPFGPPFGAGWVEVF
jgi:hypothetical protein